MTKQTFEFEGASVDASAPVVVDYAVPNGEYTSITSVREIMRITTDGVWIDPGLPTDDAVKVVIAALDEHIKHVFAKKDAAIRRALELLGPQAPECCGCRSEWNEAIGALEEVLQ